MKRLLIGCLAVLACAGVSFGQPPASADFHPQVTWGDCGPAHLPWPTCESPCFWAGSDYLVWWLKRPPQPVPLITTGDPNSPVPGGLGQPGTQILAGGGASLPAPSYGGASGVRATLGGWLDTDQRIGLEAVGFLLEQRAAGINLASLDGTTPVLSIPFNDVIGGETAIVAGGNPNSVAAINRIRFLGGEANGLLNLCRGCWSHLEMLAGFRCLELREDFLLADTIFDPVTSGQQILQDHFGTRNRFYGGQIGLRAGLIVGLLSANVTTLVALGSNNETLAVTGYTQITSGAFGLPTGVYPGGIFAQASNLGLTTRDRFAVVPEVRVQLGYRCCECLKVNVGYNFLYISSVLRPTNQIDRTLNFSTTPLAFLAGVTPTGPARPAPLFQPSYFFAQGLTFGLELNF